MKTPLMAYFRPEKITESIKMRQNRKQPHGTWQSSLRTAVSLMVLVFILAGAVGCAGLFGGKQGEKTANELAEEGKALFEDGKYADALKSFERLRDWYPYSEYAREAKLRIADAHFHLEQYEQALVAYDQYEQLHPSDSRIPYVIYQMGMCHYQRIKTIDRTQVPTRDAMEAFLRLQARFPDSQWSEKAEEKIADCRRNLAGHEFYVARFYFKSGNYRAAKNRFETVVEKYPDVDEYSDKARNHIEMCLDHLPEDARAQGGAGDGWVQLPPIEFN